ncbi:ABC transporter ATP-binding protein [Tomitella fengzijianii]|uniref:ABC transporter n=1 Tax=Tomitella fengzijianii TaxID=2597660 RepID=A0A516X5Z1_9ACTN|nr:ABC transporter ATP-binding protein [Tomitella fengzijianii]QDQ98487.1 hypothetical protein FO059_15610 [Tomitella fengzijianii]
MSAEQPDTADTTEIPEAPARPVAIAADGLHATGPDGPVFGPVDLRIAEGGLHILQSPSGSGRTALLLALAGRFKVDAGTLTVLGARRPSEIRRSTALAGFRDIDEIDDAVRVRAVVREQLAWNSPWYRPAPRFDDGAYSRLTLPVFGELAPPSPAAYIQDLGELELLLLRIALALSASDARVLLVDDLEQVRDLGEQAVLARRLAAVGEHRTVVASAINPLPHPAPPHTLHVPDAVAPAPRQKGA